MNTNQATPFRFDVADDDDDDELCCSCWYFSGICRLFVREALFSLTGEMFVDRVPIIAGREEQIPARFFDKLSLGV